MKHCRIPPSSGKVWGICHAWPDMAEKFPQEETTDTLEGDAVHEMCALDILNHIHPNMGVEVLTEGKISTNGTVITQMMVDAAEVYVDDFINEWKPGMTTQVEKRVNCHRIHGTEAWGTPDCWLYDPERNLIINWDFKYGHLYVDAFENDQGIIYLDGILATLGLDPMKPVNIEVRIVQPRCYSGGGPIKIWKTDSAQLVPHWERLNKAALVALSGEGQCVPGSHCRRCQARHNCEAYLRYGIDLYVCAMDPSFHPMSDAAQGLQLVMIEQAMEALKGLQTGKQAELEARIKAGNLNPFWGLKPSVGRENWTIPPEKRINMAKMYGIDISKPDTKTPGQSRKLGLPESIVAKYTERKTGLQLVRDDGAEITRIFKGE